MPPDFCKAALAKADANEAILESLSIDQEIAYQSARNALTLASRGVKIDSTVLANARRVIENPTETVAVAR
jgi:hypothetical protein